MSDSNRSTSFRLKPYDAISIKPIPLWKEGESIEINGEVKFPGVYSIKMGESLFEVIQRAGGLPIVLFRRGRFFPVKASGKKKTNNENDLSCN